MIIFRYLAREVGTALMAITSVLLLIFLSNQFIRYLAKAAAGELSASFVLRLMMLEIPNLLGLLLPLGLFLAIVLAYGRMYADNEMTILAASGLARKRLIAMTLAIAGCVALVVAVLTLYVGPKVAADRGRLLSEGASVSVMDTIPPGRFQTTSNGKQVVYVEKVTRDRSRVKRLFAAQQVSPTAGNKRIGSEWTIVTATDGKVVDDHELSGRFFVANNGHRYQGVAGKKNYEVTQFGQYGLRLKAPVASERHDIRALPTAKLWPLNNNNRRYAAELQWRISVPLMAMILALIAVPLCQIRPRQGKYAKVLPAVLLLMIYANGMFSMRYWLRNGTVSPSIGMWGLHACFIGFALLLLLTPKLSAYLKRFKNRALQC